MLSGPGRPKPSGEMRRRCPAERGGFHRGITGWIGVIKGGRFGNYSNLMAITCLVRPIREAIS